MPDHTRLQYNIITHDNVMSKKIRHHISIIDSPSALIAGSVFVFSYLGLVNLLDHVVYRMGAADNLAASLLITDAASALLAILISLCFVRGTFRSLAGMLFLDILFIAVILFDVARSTVSLMIWTESLLRLTATAAGGWMGIYFHNTYRSAPQESLPPWPETPLTNNTARHPQTALILSRIALPLINLALVVLLLSPLIVAGWLYLRVWPSGMEIYFKWVILGLGTLFCAVLTFRLLRGIVFTPPPLQPALQVDSRKAPVLKELVREVAARLKTPPPALLMISAEPTLFINSGKTHIFNGVMTGRALGLGLPLIKALNKEELQALIAYTMSPLTGPDRYFSQHLLPVLATFRGALTEIDKIEEKERLEKSKRRILDRCPFPQRFFLQVAADLLQSLENLLVPGRATHARQTAARLFSDQLLSQAAQKAARIEESFHETVRTLPFSEDNLYLLWLTRFHDLYPNQHTDSTMTAIEQELQPLEKRISLIYQYYREITRYYTEFYHLLKQYRGDSGRPALAALFNALPKEGPRS